MRGVITITTIALLLLITACTKIPSSNSLVGTTWEEIYPATQYEKTTLTFVDETRLLGVHQSFIDNRTYTNYWYYKLRNKRLFIRDYSIHNMSQWAQSYAIELKDCNELIIYNWYPQDFNLILPVKFKKIK